MSLEDLQRTLDTSLAGASAFTRELFETDPWDAARVEEYANEDGGMTVATTGRDDNPHAAIVVSGCADGIFYFTASPRSALLGNLRRNPSMAFTVGGKIMGRGDATLVGRASDLAYLAPRVSKTLRALIESDWDGYVYSIALTRLFANSS